MADIPDGVFDVSGGDKPTFSQVGGKPIDPEIFARLGLVLLQAKIDGDDPYTLVEKVAAVDLGVARRLRAVADDPQSLSMLLSAIIGAIAAVAAATISSGSPPDVTTIKVYTDRQNEDDLRRYRDSVRQFQEKGGPLPSWSSKYL